MKHVVQIPGNWDGFESLSEIAERERDPSTISLCEAIERGTWRKQGRGMSLVVELSEAEVSTLHGEAEYQDEYWNTDAYGVKSGGAYVPEWGRAARALHERMKKLMLEIYG